MGQRLPVRRLAGPERPRRGARIRRVLPARSSPPPTSPAPPRSSPRRRDCSAREADAVRYGALAAEVRQAFASEYVTGAGRMMSDAPTAYALALEFALLPDQAQRAHAGKRLAGLVRAGGYKIGTGFVGTPLICDALAETGHLDAAYRLLLQTEQPSWLHPVTQGATTIWSGGTVCCPTARSTPAA
nr:hypothetical protein [Streptomyces sp. LBUM 1481]